MIETTSHNSPYRTYEADYLSRFKPNFGQGQVRCDYCGGSPGDGRSCFGCGAPTGSPKPNVTPAQESRINVPTFICNEAITAERLNRIRDAIYELERRIKRNQ